MWLMQRVSDGCIRWSQVGAVRCGCIQLARLECQLRWPINKLLTLCHASLYAAYHSLFIRTALSFCSLQWILYFLRVFLLSKHIAPRASSFLFTCVHWSKHIVYLSRFFLVYSSVKHVVHSSDLFQPTMFSQTFALYYFIFTLVANSQPSDNSDEEDTVIILTKDNFDEALKDFSQILVNFCKWL